MYFMLVSGVVPYLLGFIYLYLVVAHLLVLYFFYNIFGFSEIDEIFNFPSHMDVEPISGVVWLLSGQRSVNISMRALQDVEAESKEVFSVKLISSRGGARISSVNSLAKLAGLWSTHSHLMPCWTRYIGSKKQEYLFVYTVFYNGYKLQVGI